MKHPIKICTVDEVEAMLETAKYWWYLTGKQDWRHSSKEKTLRILRNNPGFDWKVIESNGILHIWPKGRRNK